MNRIFTISFFIALLVAMSCSNSVNSQTIHEWRGPERTGVYNETGLLKSWPEGGPALQWEVLDLGKGYSSPVIVGDKIYVTGLSQSEDKEVLFAYTTKGEKLYEVEYGTPWKDSFPPNRTTPTIIDNKAYVISGKGEVVCIDIEKGAVVWTVDGQEQFQREQGNWGTAESPAVIDNKVIYTPGGKQTTMVALDAETGTLVWQTESLGDISSYVSPLLIDYKGKKQIVGNTVLHVFGVNPENGEIEWTFKDWSVEKKSEHGRICVNTPLFKDGKLFVCHGYDQEAFMLQLGDDLKSAQLLWKNMVLDTHIGGIVLVDGIVYGSNWINNGQGNWVAIDWNTGETKYENPWAGGKSKGSIISADGMLYCYDERRGFVGLVNSTPEKFDVVSEFRVTQGADQHWAHPVINNGILYIRHGNALLAYNIKA